MKKILTLLVIFTLVATFVPSGTLIVKADVSFSGGGTGAIDKPYVLKNYEDLKLLSQNVSSILDKSFVLANDITIPSATTWNPIGTSSSKFTGTFDGKGHKVNLNNNTSLNGFFGYVNAGTIRRLAVANAKVEAGNTPENIGVLVGSLTGESNVENCYASGTASANSSNLGGLFGVVVGKNNGSKAAKIKNCYANVTLTGIGAGFAGNCSNYNFSNVYYTDSNHRDNKAVFKNINDQFTFTDIGSYLAKDVWKNRDHNCPDLKTYVDLKLYPNFDNREATRPTQAVNNVNSFANGLTESGLNRDGTPITITYLPDKSLNGKNVSPQQDLEGWYPDQACIEVTKKNIVPTVDGSYVYYAKWYGNGSDGVNTYSFSATQQSGAKELGVKLGSFYFPAVYTVGDTNNYAAFTRGKYTIVFTGISSSTSFLEPNKEYDLQAYWIDGNGNTQTFGRIEKIKTGSNTGGVKN